MQITSLSSFHPLQIPGNNRQNYAAQTTAGILSPVKNADSADIQEIITLNPARLLNDDEVDTVLAMSTASIRNDPGLALSVHRGLDAGRVAALLADID